MVIAPHLSKDGCGVITPTPSILVGFGTLKNRLPWFHRAVPSTTLDKVFNFGGFAKVIVSYLCVLSTPFSQKVEIHPIFSLVKHQSGFANCPHRAIIAANTTIHSMPKEYAR